MGVGGVRVCEDAGDAVGGDAGGREEASVCGARRHRRDHGHAGPHLLGELFDGAEDFRREARWCAGLFGRRLQGDLYLLVADGGLKLLLNFLLGVTGEDAAVDVGCRALRQRVRRVAGGQHGCDAGRAEGGVVAGVGHQAADGRGVLAVGGVAHVLAFLAGRDGAHATEEAGGGVVELDGEFERLHLHQGGAEFVDRVVRHGTGRVTAGVGHFEREILIEFLAGLHAVEDVLAGLGIEPAASAFIEREGGVDEVAMVLHHVSGADKLAVGFLAAVEHHLDGAGGAVAFLLVADHRVREDRGHRLVVAGAARVEIAAVFGEDEGVAHPVFALGLHHVDVRHQHDGFLSRVRAGEDGDEVAVLRAIGTGVHEDVEIALRVAGGDEARLHAFGRERAGADGEGGVGFDQLFIKSAELGFVRAGVGRGGGRAGCCRGAGAKGECGGGEKHRSHGVILNLSGAT